MKLKPVHAALAAGAVSLLALGALAGSVTGDDGTVELADRIDADPGPPVSQVATPSSPAAKGAGKRKRGKRAKKPIVFNGAGEINELAAGEGLSVLLTCPRKYKVPVAPGFEGTGGVVATNLSRQFGTPRAVRVTVVNVSGEPQSFRATTACMKGVKEK